MPRKKAYRLVVDTNLWISMLISRDFSDIDKLLNNNQAILIFSKELLEEFIEVVYRPKFQKFLLSLAKDGKADFVLSGDKDLLDLKKFESTEVITIREFSERK